ncbi:MAG: type II toxin-antitoxin system RelE/ParE family toxin [Euryarchaeota archaeon]|nr:type II toxin-antitoxin system RelE/ParE family toxin [Euryarchaeota archaeon]
MEYEILLHPEVKKEFDKLSKKQQVIFLKKLDKIRQNPEIGKPLKYDLKGRRTLYFERKFRIIYSVDNERKDVLVLKLEHRKKAYD